MITRLNGKPPIVEIAGLADNWWQLRDSLVAVYRGEAIFFEQRIKPMVLIYEGATVND